MWTLIWNELLPKRVRRAIAETIVIGFAVLGVVNSGLQHRVIGFIVDRVTHVFCVEKIEPPMRAMLDEFDRQTRPTSVVRSRSRMCQP